MCVCVEGATLRVGVTGNKTTGADTLMVASETGEQQEAGMTTDR